MAKRKPASELPRTVAEFDAWHARQPERWELIAGAPVMMAPGSLSHTAIKGNVFAALHTKLTGSPCRAFVDGAQVKGPKLSAIPDVVVACGRIDYATPTIAEPVVIVEVLSPYSERDDTLRKWQGYCLISSLQHYLVVAQDSRFVTLHTRTGAAAFEERVFQDGVIELGGLGVSLALDEIYAGVEFEPEADDA